MTPRVVAAVWLAGVWSASACSACYGKSDSSLAQGMNWGIFTLLGVILAVLAGVAAFFVFLARKASTLEPPAAPGSASHPAISSRAV